MAKESKKLGFWKIMGLVSTVSSLVAEHAADGKLSARDGIRILETVCIAMGVNLDKTGVDI